MSTATWVNTDTVVTKLTLRGRKLDSLVAPQRLTHLLRTVDLHPPGFPPDAILCIRRCRTRIPASWATHPHTVLPSLEWQRTLQRSIDQLRHRAVRPLYEAVPPSAEAVLFADRAELLACMAKDWCDGTLPTRWWWQSLFPQQVGDAAFLRAWQESPEHIPSTLQVLARLGLLVPVMKRLPEHEVRMLSRLLERTFGLTELASWSLGGTKEPGQSTELSMPPDLSVWDRWVPELFRSRLDLDRQRLVGVGLMLHRAPSVVRSSAFASSFQRWYRAVTEEVAVRSPREGQGLQGPEDNTREKRLAMEEAAAPPLTTDHTAIVVPVSPSLQDFSGASVMSSESIKGRERDGVATERAPIRRDKSETASNPSKDRITKPEQRPSWPLSHATTIQTERGGVFYLINVGLFLDLYGDFSQPLRPGLALPIWDFLALVGERLVGPELMEDPVWPLLGRLAGREEGQRPGATFDPPTDWHLPREWAQPFAAGEPWRWAWTEGRLQVWHQAEFVLVDCAMEGEPSSQDVRTLLQDYRQNGELVQVDGSASMPNPEPLDRWLAWLLPYLRARLARALAPDGTTDWPTVLINHRATLAMTDTRLDVTFSLNQHPLAIRIAGLDRDPGWVPAAGRFVAFHYQVP